MPLSLNDDAIAIVDLNNPAQQVPIASGSATSTANLGFLMMGVTTAGTASFAQFDNAGAMKVTGSVGIAGSLSTTNASTGVTGSSMPAQGTFIAGFDSTTNFLRGIAVDPSGRVLMQMFNTASVIVSGTPTITGSVSVLNTVNVTGSMTVPNTVTVTGSVTIGSPIVTATNAVRVSDPKTDATSTASLNVLNAAVTLDMSGSSGCGFQLQAGTLVGTLTPEASFDGGTTWVATGFYDVDTKGIAETITVSSTTTSRNILLPAGTGLARVRVSAFTSGASTGVLRGSQTPPQVNYVAQLDGRRATYIGTTTAFASATTATDIFYIAGSATKTIRVLRIQVYATQTTAAAANIFLIKRSTANTLGTAVATTKVPLNSQNAAATATVQHYTANPTVGTTVGTVQAYRGILPAGATLINNPICTWEFGRFSGQAIVLRGTAEGLAVNLNSVTIAGGSFIITCEWTEE